MARASTACHASDHALSRMCVDAGHQVLLPARSHIPRRVPHVLCPPHGANVPRYDRPFLDDGASLVLNARLGHSSPDLHRRCCSGASSSRDRSCALHRIRVLTASRQSCFPACHPADRQAVNNYQVRSSSCVPKFASCSSQAAGDTTVFLLQRRGGACMQFTSAGTVATGRNRPQSASSARAMPYTGRCTTRLGSNAARAPPIHAALDLSATAGLVTAAASCAVRACAPEGQPGRHLCVALHP